MSQVLIGIIGVILFIGLALAGALFLGPQFQESANNSKASAVVQAASQTAAAYEMYRVQEGRRAPSAAALVAGDYLKTIPANATNPTAGGEPWVDDLDGDGTADHVTMLLAGNDAEVCLAINKQSNGATTVPVAAQTGVSGCYETAASSGVYVAYAKL